MVTLKPGTSTFTFQVPGLRPVNVRVIKVDAATWPWAIEGMLRALASIGSMPGKPAP